MGAYLWPLVSCSFITKIIRLRKKNIGEIKKTEKYSEKFTLGMYITLCVCVVDYIYVLLCVVVYGIICRCICVWWYMRLAAGLRLSLIYKWRDLLQTSRDRQGYFCVMMILTKEQIIILFALWRKWIFWFDI